MKKLLFVNDILWIITAICCVFFDNTIITSIVVLTTIVYAIDLFIKFRKMDYQFKPFIKKHWLDILFLIPVGKIFRGFRIIKVGKLTKALFMMDMANDTVEFITRSIRFKKKIKDNRKENK